MESWTYLKLKSNFSRQIFIGRSLNLCRQLLNFSRRPFDATIHQFVVISQARKQTYVVVDPIFINWNSGGHWEAIAVPGRIHSVQAHRATSFHVVQCSSHVTMAEVSIEGKSTNCSFAVFGCNTRLNCLVFHDFHQNIGLGTSNWGGAHSTYRQFFSNVVTSFT